MKIECKEEKRKKKIWMKGEEEEKNIPILFLWLRFINFSERQLFVEGEEAAERKIPFNLDV